MKTKNNSAAELLGIIEEKDRRITELEQQNQWLLEQFRLLRRKQYGTSSEQVIADQVSIFNEAEASADLAAAEPSLTEVKAHYRKGKSRLTTDKLPEDLPVEIIEHELPEDERACPECGGNLHVMGKETREEIRLIPAKAVIVRHVRNVYACRNCENTSDHVPIIKADMPEPVIKGGFASPDAIAHIATQKFMMASPLYRQEQEWKQNGILLSRQTMSNWLLKASEDWLVPIYEAMKHRLLEHSVLHGDETVCQVLKEPGKTAQSRSYMWLYRTSGEAKHQILVYEYQPDRKHIHPEEFLVGFSGYFHADGYDGYHKLPDRVIVVGCFAHMRRKLFDAMKSLPKDKQAGSNAAKGVEYCDRLFHLEKQFALLTPAQRLAERERLSRPLVNEFFDWIERLNALPNTLLGKAEHYAKSQRKYLERYLLDGRLEISNNRAERGVKPFVIGRKNWLFSNMPNGAKASAIYYSLVVTAMENGLNPFEYLSWILTNAPNMGKKGYVTSVEDFLPGSDALPARVFSPKPGGTDSEKHAWEED
ncbi:MAG: IS66 family transposase [Eubacteriales bacterium]|nr:IS66 family transposase [Proteiniphilum sp.]MDD4121581.1 IS66 family transposase [Eubacteriales bacterium]